MNVWMEWELCHQIKKAIIEYVRSGEFLFDSPTYLKMDVLTNLLFLHTFLYRKALNQNFKLPHQK